MANDSQMHQGGVITQRLSEFKDTSVMLSTVSYVGVTDYEVTIERCTKTSKTPNREIRNYIRVRRLQSHLYKVRRVTALPPIDEVRKYIVTSFPP